MWWDRKEKGNTRRSLSAQSWPHCWAKRWVNVCRPQYVQSVWINLYGEDKNVYETPLIRHELVWPSYYVEMMCLNPSGTSELLGLILEHVACLYYLCQPSMPWLNHSHKHQLFSFCPPETELMLIRQSIFILSRCCIFVTWRRKSSPLVVLTCCLALHRHLFNVLVEHKVSTAGTCCIMMWDPLSSRMTPWKTIKWMLHNSDRCEPLFLTQRSCL